MRSFLLATSCMIFAAPVAAQNGRNTTAGLISLVSARPRLGEFRGSADIGYGNYDAVQGTGVLNVPLGTSAALRAAVNYDHRDSYLTPANDTYDVDPFKDNLSGRLSLLVKPTDRLTVVVRGDYSVIKGHPGPQVLLSTLYQGPFANPADGALGQNPVPRSGGREALSTVGYSERRQSNRDNRSWGIQGDVTYELSDTLTASYVGSYRKFKRDEEFTGVTGLVRATGLYATTPQSSMPITRRIRRNCALPMTATPSICRPAASSSARRPRSISSYTVRRGSSRGSAATSSVSRRTRCRSRSPSSVRVR